MAIPVLIIGKSGSGKSTSLRNFKKDELALINVINKPLPFKGSFDSVIVSDSYEYIKNKISKTNKSIIVIDDAGYLITNHFMKNHSSTGKGNGVFTLYNEIGDHFWGLIEFSKTLSSEKIVYFIMHEEQTDFGDIKPKTIGKLLDEKVCLEGMFSIVLRSVVADGGYWFKTKTTGQEVVKTPMDMFKNEYVENDLKYIDSVIKNYYEIGVKK